MVFKKKKPEFTREELEGMLKEQDTKEKADHIQREDPDDSIIEEIEIDDDDLPTLGREEVGDIEEIEVLPRTKPKPKPKVTGPSKKVPEDAKIISQTEANQIIEEEEKQGSAKMDLDDFKNLSVEDQAGVMEEFQRLHRLKIMYYEYSEMYKLYGSN